MPTANCFCPEPEHLRHVRDTSDFCTQVDVYAVQALDDWRSVLTDFSSFDEIQDAFEEAKMEFQTNFDLNSICSSN